MKDENEKNLESFSDEEIEIIKKNADDWERMGKYGYIYVIGFLFAALFGCMVLLFIILPPTWAFAGLLLIGMFLGTNMIFLLPNFKKHKKALQKLQKAIKIEGETDRKLIPDELKYTRLYRIYKEEVIETYNSNR